MLPYSGAAHRANLDVFLDQKAYPKERKKHYQQNGKDHPSGRRNFSGEIRGILRSAARAAVPVINHLRWLLVSGNRIGRLLIPHRKIGERLHLIDLPGFFRRSIRRQLKLIGLPNIRAGRFMFVRRRILMLILAQNYSTAAKATKVAAVIIHLSAILTLNHRDLFQIQKVGEITSSEISTHRRRKKFSPRAEKNYRWKNIISVLTRKIYFDK